MCGIVGFVDKKSIFSETERQTLVRVMLTQMAHRGKDSSGIYVDGSVAIGHNRLAILDPSECGKQPFVNSEKNLVMSYNGEIYNHLDLRHLIKHHSWFQLRTRLTAIF